MNRIFSVDGKGWPGFPMKAYARLDQTEPITPEEHDEVVFGLDAVDASWVAFGANERLNLSDFLQISRLMTRYWQSAFIGEQLTVDFDPFEYMPIYRIEITSKKGDATWGTLLRQPTGSWITIELGSSGIQSVDVYGGIFAEPVRAHLKALTATDRKLAQSLSALFDVDLWPVANPSDIQAALTSVGSLESLVALDVGQGTAIGLMDVDEDVRLYFDLGAGAYGNAGTRPVPLRFCWRAQRLVVLSHWDTDHWAGAVSDPLAKQATWIAPRQPNLGPTHNAFAARILAAGGRLMVWGAQGGSTLQANVAPHQALMIARCNGRSRNGSGISALIKDNSSGGHWLLTGDAGYHELGFVIPADLSCVVVPHHGATMAAASKPPIRPPGYTRLVYSFGPGNRHGRTQISHPTQAAVNQYIASGWNQGSWIPTPAISVAGGDVLATAQNPASPSSGVPGLHLESAAISWASPPLVPYRTLPCSILGSSLRCTSRIVQS